MKLLLRKKVFLVIFSLFLFLILLEIGLRIGGALFLSLQEYRNLREMKQMKRCRILCLGESTTFSGGEYSYPSQLEEILNKKVKGLKFTVINKGIPATNTRYIVEHLSDYLTRYQPNIVVTMMGINDEGAHMAYQDIHLPEWLSFLKTSQIFKLFSLITFNVKTKLIQLGLLSKESVNYRDPDQLEIYDKLVPTGYPLQDYLREDQVESVSVSDLENEVFYIKMGWINRYKGKYSQARHCFEQALKLNPRSDEALVGLGWLYRDKRNLLLARGYYRRAIEANPQNAMAYVCLGWSYRKQNEFNEAEAIFKKALELDPNNLSANFELGWLYRAQGKFPEAEAVLKKALKTNPQESIICGALASLYQDSRRYQEADSYYRRYSEYRKKSVNMLISYNYWKLKKILDSKGIWLVAVQYPVRSLVELKNMLPEGKRIIFVDNEASFQEAIKKEGYSEYFTDMFGGVFGHCTPKGNRLLAENIANGIIEASVFKETILGGTLEKIE